MAYVERRKPDVGNVTWAHLRVAPFPQVAARVLQLAQQDDVQLHEFGDLIASDSAFASEVLALSNSLLFAPRFPCSSIVQAVAVLGISNLQGICLTVGARAYMGKALNHPFTKAVWRHNLACALISEKIASAGFINKDVAYTAGMLHDVGRLALSTVRPKEYGALLETFEGPADAILEAERERFGVDHCQVGGLLLENWKFPSEFEAVVSDHHAPRLPESAWSMAELVKISCKMADAMGFSAFPGCQATTPGELLEQIPSRERRGFEPELDALAAMVSAKIQAVEAP